jgi:hypothetical protein
MASCATLVLEADGIAVSIATQDDQGEGGELPGGAPKTVAFDFSKLFRVAMCVASCLAAPAPAVDVAGDATNPHRSGPAVKPPR